MNIIASSLVLMSLTTAPPPPPPPLSGFMNSERLIEHCRPGVDAEAGMADVCMGYIAGAVDQLLARQGQLAPNKRTICLPPTTTIGEVQRAVAASLEMFEGEPNAAAAVIVERSVTAAFPC
jgi:hypothetical protein